MRHLKSICHNMSQYVTICRNMPQYVAMYVNHNPRQPSTPVPNGHRRRRATLSPTAAGDYKLAVLRGESWSNPMSNSIPKPGFMTHNLKAHVPCEALAFEDQ